jgi:hypothetical protein
MLAQVVGIEMDESAQCDRHSNEFVTVLLPGHRLKRAHQVCHQPAAVRACSASRISWVVLRTVSGFSEMLSMPQRTKKRANSG